MIFLPDLTETMAGAHYDERRLSAPVLEGIAALCADCGLVGLSVMTPSFLLASQITDALHAHDVGPVLWGGIHATACPRECLEHADLACVGEGEALIVGLAHALESGADYHHLPNLAWLNEHGELATTPLGPLCDPLDDLPFPDYDLADHHIVHDGRLQPMTERHMAFYSTDLISWASGPVYGIFSSRGCPYSCTYCGNNAYAAMYPGWSRLRHRTPANVIAELNEARRIMPWITGVILRDDTFLAHTHEWLEEFCTLYRQEVGLCFRVYTTAQTADPAKLELLMGIGQHFEIIMGIQSGSPAVQKQYKRTSGNEKMIHAATVLQSVKELAPRPRFDVITDNPYEGHEDRWATLRLVNELPRPYRLSLFSLTFYPGTELQRIAQADGMDHLGPDPYRNNFQIQRPGYYNLALYCHGQLLPRPILNLIASRTLFDLGSRQPFDWMAGVALRTIMALRLFRNQRDVARRRREWLSNDAPLPRG
jgi:radical SAM superfamily enzyme YgiQ (UPF0313 family)